MQNKNYIIKDTKDINSRGSFYESMKANQISDLYDEETETSIVSYHIGDCSLVVKQINGDLTPKSLRGRKDLKASIYHETSLDKIIVTKNLIEEITGRKLE